MEREPTNIVSPAFPAVGVAFLWAWVIGGVVAYRDLLGVVLAAIGVP